MKQNLQLLSDLFTTLEQSIDDCWANPEQSVDKSSCWACKKVPQSCSIHFKLNSNPRCTWKAGSATRNYANCSFSVSLHVYIFHLAFFHLVSSIMGGSCNVVRISLSLDEVGVEWSGSGPIMILWLVIGPNFRGVVFHSLTCLLCRYAVLILT